MATPVEMPKLGNTVEECLIASWRKQAGDPVAAGEVLAEVETDKATFDITAPIDGVLLATFFAEGDLVPVFTNLCVVGSAGEDAESYRPGSAAGVAVMATESAPAVIDEPIRVSVPVAVGAAGLAESADAGSGSPWSPRARRFAREHDLVATAVTGTGPHGRVTEADVRGLLYSVPRVSEAARASLGEGAKVPAVAGSGVGGMIRRADLVVPVESVEPVRSAKVSSVRARTAKRLRESLATTAQYTLTSSASAGQLLALRRGFKANPATAAININDLVLFCTVHALLDMP